MEAPRGATEAVGEGEEDAGGGAEGEECGGEAPMDLERAAAVVGEERGEDGEGEDGGGGEEHVQPGGAAEDEVEDIDNVRLVGTIVVTAVGSGGDGGFEEDPARVFFIIH